MGHPVVHFEIGCKDRAKTEQFFGELFGWKIQNNGAASDIDTASQQRIAGHITSWDTNHSTTYSGRQDAGAAHKHPDRDVRLVLRSRGQHDRFAEAQPLSRSSLRSRQCATRRLQLATPFEIKRSESMWSRFCPASNEPWIST